MSQRVTIKKRTIKKRSGTVKGKYVKKTSR